MAREANLEGLPTEKLSREVGHEHDAKIRSGARIFIGRCTAKILFFAETNRGLIDAERLSVRHLNVRRRRYMRERGAHSNILTNASGPWPWTWARSSKQVIQPHRGKTYPERACETESAVIDAGVVAASGAVWTRTNRKFRRATNVPGMPRQHSSNGRRSWVHGRKSGGGHRQVQKILQSEWSRSVSENKGEIRWQQARRETRNTGKGISQ